MKLAKWLALVALLLPTLVSPSPTVQGNGSTEAELVKKVAELEKKLEISEDNLTKLGTNNYRSQVDLRSLFFMKMLECRKIELECKDADSPQIERIEWWIDVIDELNGSRFTEVEQVEDMLGLFNENGKELSSFGMDENEVTSMTKGIVISLGKYRDLAFAEGGPISEVERLQNEVDRLRMIKEVPAAVLNASYAFVVAYVSHLHNFMNTRIEILEAYDEGDSKAALTFKKAATMLNDLNTEASKRLLTLDGIDRWVEKLSNREKILKVFREDGSEETAVALNKSFDRAIQGLLSLKSILAH